MKSKIELQITLILSYIISIIFVFNSNSIFSRGINAGRLNKIGLLLLIISVLTFLIFSISVKDFDFITYFLIILILILYILMYILVQRNKTATSAGIRYLMSFILIFSLAYILSKSNTELLFFNAYSNIVVIIATISLVFWLLGSTLHVIYPSGIYLSNWNQLGIYQPVPSYHNLYFETQVVNQFVRNSSIFAEAPMASLTFSIALCIESLYLTNSKFHKIKMIILSVAIVSTVSSTGYICLIFIYGYMLLSDKSILRKYAMFKYLVVALSLVIGAILINYFLSQKLSSNSGISRSQDYINSIKAWLKYPLLGTGIDAVGSNIASYDRIDIGNFGYSNSLGGILGSTGLYIFALYLISLVRSIYIGVIEKSGNRLFFTFIIMYLFITTNFMNTYMIFFLFSLISVWRPGNLIKKVI